MKHLKTYKLFENSSILNFDDFPSNELIKDFFVELTDNDIVSNIEIREKGYLYLTPQYFDRKVLTAFLDDARHNPKFPDNKVEILAGDTWRNFFLTASNETKWVTYEIFELQNVEKLSKIDSIIYDNIINGNIKAYPYIEIAPINICIKHEGELRKESIKEKEILFECLDNLYQSTDFRPIGHSWEEDYVDESNGEIVTLLNYNLKLFNTTDIEYKALTHYKSISQGSSINNEHNLELINRFL